MNETSTNQKICQDPNEKFESPIFENLKVFLADLPLTDDPESLWGMIKLLGLGEAKKQYCTDFDHCGHSMVGYTDGSSLRFGGVKVCRNPKCPVTQVVKAFKFFKGIKYWPGFYMVKVSDQCYRERVALEEAKMLVQGGRRIPVEGEQAIIFTPEPITGSEPFTGGWLSLYHLVAQVPEGKNLTHIRAKTDKVGGTETSDGANEGQEQEGGIPLKGERSYFSTPLSTEELSVACGEAGFPLSQDRDGSLSTPRAETIMDCMALNALINTISNPHDGFRLHLQLVLKQESAGLLKDLGYQIIRRPAKRPKKQAEGAARAA